MVSFSMDKTERKNKKQKNIHIHYKRYQYMYWDHIALVLWGLSSWVYEGINILQDNSLTQIARKILKQHERT